MNTRTSPSWPRRVIRIFGTISVAGLLATATHWIVRFLFQPSDSNFVDYMFGATMAVFLTLIALIVAVLLTIFEAWWNGGYDEEFLHF